MKSQLERNIAAQLTNANITFEYESTSFRYLKSKRLKGVRVLKDRSELLGKVSLLAKYTPDFFLTKRDGSPMVIEAKGKMKPVIRTMIKTVLKTYPGMDYRMVFYRLDKEKIKFCEQLNIPYAQDLIPKEWLEEVIWT